MKLIIDSREPSFVKEPMQKFFEDTGEPFEIEIKELEAGDFQCNNILIERKEINDFYASIIDGRYKSQKVKLASKINDGMHVYLVIHGDINSLYQGNMSPRMYCGAIASLNEIGIHTLHVPEPGLIYVFEMFYALIRKYDDERVLTTPFIEPAVDNFTQKTLMCIYGIGEETAENIINEYSEKLPAYFQRSPEKLRDDLTRVKGVGWKTAERIVNELYGDKVL